LSAASARPVDAAGPGFRRSGENARRKRVAGADAVDDPGTSIAARRTASSRVSIRADER
jgi:hypothetical protein